MASAAPTSRLAYFAVMLVAAGFVLLYVVKGGSRPRQAGGADTATRAVDVESVVGTGNAEGIVSAIRGGMSVTEPLRSGPHKGLSPLHVVVVRGIDGAIAPIVGAGADVDARTADGTTALMLACTRDSLPAIQELLKAGASPDIRDSFGRTALMLAARAGKAGPVGVLIKAGADVKGADGSGATALAHAADRPINHEVMTLLLGAGSEVDLADAQGVTPLMRAAERADAQQVVQLLDAGAAARAKSRDGRTALDRARGRKDASGREVVAVLSDAGS